MESVSDKDIKNYKKNHRKFRNMLDNIMFTEKAELFKQYLKNLQTALYCLTGQLSKKIRSYKAMSTDLMVWYFTYSLILIN